MTDPVNLHELRPTRTGALAAQEERAQDSRVPAAAAHPYRSIARAVCHDAEWSFNEWFEKGGDDPVGEPPALMTVAELNERCQPLIQALQCARAA